MQHDNQTPAETPERVCARAVTASADIMAALRRLLGAGASRTQLGKVAEAAKQIQAQVSSLQCDLAGRLSRTDNGAGSGEVLRDQLGVTNREAKQLSQMSRRLEEMPNTRAKLQAGEITMSNAAALANAAGECGARQVDQNRGLLAEAATFLRRRMRAGQARTRTGGCWRKRRRLIRMISASGPAGGPTLTARTGAKGCWSGRRGAGKRTCFGARTWRWESCTPRWTPSASDKCGKP